MRDKKYRSKVWEHNGLWHVSVEFTCNGHGVWYKCWLEERTHRLMDDEYIYRLSFRTRRQAEEKASALLSKMVEDSLRCDAPRLAEDLATVVEVGV